MEGVEGAVMGLGGGVVDGFDGLLLAGFIGADIIVAPLGGILP